MITQSISIKFTPEQLHGLMFYILWLQLHCKVDCEHDLCTIGKGQVTRLATIDEEVCAYLDN